eukprot:CAMPEP_0181204904 /NCGR_PEP_ID=MMETSP1096-20121128/20186_1 /TAXON_ID=156174 ORGANISM="Chrysochromulina ericina, Strain CCMP281" /NCGR_SAMPLE_ID=MMETSP1096 /ASSEMBLY_ACC=CAM_ASM_000453 /LENGTH=47 /DNA_ID= /DNA_START= /DNA_END= /DNA_ORIENTATION=
MFCVRCLDLVRSGCSCGCADLELPRCHTSATDGDAAPVRDAGCPCAL